MLRGARTHLLWRRCRRIAESLPLPEPLGIAALGPALTERIGRPVELLALPSESAGSCGLLVSTDRAEYIGYPRDTTGLHQLHIVLHEVGHLLCGHRGGGPLAEAPAVRALTPQLSGELVRRVLGRGAYTDPQEQEAELFATLVMHRVSADRSVRPAGPPGPAERAAALGRLFDTPSARAAPTAPGE